MGELVGEVVAGYHGVAPLSEAELALLPDLVRTRLALSVVMAGWQHAKDPATTTCWSARPASGPP